jgi:hypothetical protein
MSNFDLLRLLFSQKEFLVQLIEVEHIFISISQVWKQPTD